MQTNHELPVSLSLIPPHSYYSIIYFSLELFLERIVGGERELLFVVVVEIDGDRRREMNNFIALMKCCCLDLIK